MIARTFVLLGATLWGSVAVAQGVPGPDTVCVDVAPCAGEALDVAGLTEDIRVELTSDGIRDVQPLEAAGAEPPHGRATAVVTIAQVDCGEALASFVIRIDDRATDKQVERRVELSDVPRAIRPRALALGVAELMRASWAELATRAPGPTAPPAIVEATLHRARLWLQPDPRSLGDPARGAEPSEPPLRARRRDAAITIAFLVRSLASAGLAPIGARVGFDLRLLRELAVELHAEVGVAGAHHALGVIELGLATAGVGIAYTARIDDVALMLGARASIGGGWARGQSHDDARAIGGSGAGPVLSIAAGLELDVPLHENASLRFGVDVGGLPLGFEARVSGAPITGIVGASIGAWTGIALLP